MSNAAVMMNTVLRLRVRSLEGRDGLKAAAPNVYEKSGRTLSVGRVTVRY